MYIGEVSKHSGASPKAIRLYESIGLLVNITRKGSYRIYDESDLAFVKLIKEAQSLGITLSDLRQLLIGRNQLNWQQVLGLLTRKEEQVVTEIASLKKQHGLLQEYYSKIQNCLNDT